MDIWKYYDITHKEHLFCNPTSSNKINELINILKLLPGAKVLDIASGKAEFLIRLAEQYQIQGLGIDLSPFCVADAQKKHQERVPAADLKFLTMDGAEYQKSNKDCFDLVSCIGASWIFKGYRGTLEALASMASPQGWIVVGEPYWKEEPAQEYLEALEIKKDLYGTHYENALKGQELGLKLMYTLVSNKDDWDRYEALQWYAAVQWAENNWDDPDRKIVLEEVNKSRDIYLKWGRSSFGWAIYVFKK